MSMLSDKHVIGGNVYDYPATYISVNKIIATSIKPDESSLKDVGLLTNLIETSAPIYTRTLTPIEQEKRFDHPVMAESKKFTGRGKGTIDIYDVSGNVTDNPNTNNRDYIAANDFPSGAATGAGPEKDKKKKSNIY